MTPTPTWREALNRTHDLLWRLRCAYHYRARLWWAGWSRRRCWDLAGETLSQQRECRALGLGFDSPSDAADEELGHWNT